MDNWLGRIMTSARSLALSSFLALALAACGGGGSSGGDNTTGDSTKETPQKVDGSSADDTLYGGTGDDTLTGLGGDDLLYGRAGSDTYIFEAGHGNDTIDDEAGATDTITLAADTDATKINLKLTENGGERSLTIETAATHSITIQNWHQSESKIERLQIGDRIYNLDSYSAEASLSELGQILNGTAGDDRLSVPYPLDGKDELYGGEGNDTLSGGDGDDYLEGGVGDDNLSGGTGDDELLGGDGDDTYIFEAGHGEDTISDIAGSDTIQLASGTDPGQVSLELVNNAGNKNLIIRTSDQDSITIQDWNQQDHKIEKIRIGPTGPIYNLGAYRDQRFLNQLNASSGDEDDTFQEGTDGNDTLRGSNGDDFFNGNEGNDTLYGRAGDDTLYGDNGDDELYGNTGNDTLYGGEGNDTYIFETGHGNDTIDDEAGSDLIQLAAGTNPGEVSLKLENGELVIRTSDQDSITIEKWTQSGYKIEKIRIGPTGQTYNLGAYNGQFNSLNQLTPID